MFLRVVGDIKSNTIDPMEKLEKESRKEESEDAEMKGKKSKGGGGGKMETREESLPKIQDINENVTSFFVDGEDTFKGKGKDGEEASSCRRCGRGE